MAIIFTERSEQIDRAGYEAWREYQCKHNGDTPDHSESFQMGAEWADHHPLQMCDWCSTDTPPVEDGYYLTIIASAKGARVEFAQWTNGKYQGASAVLVNWGIERVSHWATLNLPTDLLDIISSLKQ